MEILINIKRYDMLPEYKIKALLPNKEELILDEKSILVMPYSLHDMVLANKNVGFVSSILVEEKSIKYKVSFNSGEEEWLEPEKIKKVKDKWINLKKAIQFSIMILSLEW